MTVFVCGQDDVLAGECVECGGWLHRVREGGFDGFCDEECIADSQDRAARMAEEQALKCTVCGRQRGDCTTGHPEDPHEFIPWGQA